MVVGKGVSVAEVSGTRVGAESVVSSVAGSLMGGVKVAATVSSCGFSSPSSRGLSGSTTVSTVCRLIASLSSSYSWSWREISNSAVSYFSKICATSSECWSTRA